MRLSWVEQPSLQVCKKNDILLYLSTTHYSHMSTPSLAWIEFWSYWESVHTRFQTMTGWTFDKENLSQDFYAADISSNQRSNQTMPFFTSWSCDRRLFYDFDQRSKKLAPILEQLIVVTAVSWRPLCTERESARHNVNINNQIVHKYPFNWKCIIYKHKININNNKNNISWRPLRTERERTIHNVNLNNQD